MLKKNINIKNIRRVKNILHEESIPITTVLNKIGGKFPIKKSSFSIAKKPIVPIVKKKTVPIAKKQTVPIVKKLSNISTKKLNSKPSFSKFTNNPLLESIVKKNHSINSIITHVPKLESTINSLKKFNKQTLQTNSSVLTSTPIVTKPNNKQSSVAPSSLTTTPSNIITPVITKLNNKQPVVQTNTSVLISTPIVTKPNNKQSSVAPSSLTTIPSNIITPVITKLNNKQLVVQTNTTTPLPTKPINKKSVKGTIPNNLSLNKYVQTLLSVNNNFTKKTYSDLTPIIDNILDPSKKLTPKNRFIIKNIINTIFTKNVINSNGINILTKIIGKINNTSNIEHKTLLVMIKDNIELYGKETQYKNILSNIESKLKS